MHLAASIELIIARTLEGTTAASLRVELPSRRADLAENVVIPLDDALLRSLALDPSEYGEQLTDMVFGRRKLREAWERARGFAEGASGAIQVRLALQGDDGLHAIRWELLRDPVDQTPLAHHERVRFSRFLSSDSLTEVQAAERPSLRAVVAVANPSWLPQGMAPVNVAGEVARAQQGLDEIPTMLLDGSGGRPRATPPAIAAALRDGAHILYLVCHGDLSEGQPRLWLEQEGGGSYRPAAGDDLVQLITRLERRPLLVVLASCQGAGDTYQLLGAVGPQLARAGVGAVIAMQGNVPMELVAELAPRLFTELRRDGRIDRALAAARSALPASSAWWMPTLWMAVRDGALWRTPQAEPTRGAGVFQVPYPLNPLFRGRDAELVRLAEALLGDQPGTAAVLPAVSGTGGIGKTQLASEFAHRHRDAFPGGVFWLNMADPETVASQVAAAGGPGGLDLLGWSGLDFEAKVAAVRRAWTAPIRRLLVFDNLEEPRLLQEWRPSSGGTRVLVTTRRGVWSASSGVRPIALQTLARPESVRLLLAPRYGDQLEAALADPTVTNEANAICEQVGDLPLALALAGAYLEQMPSLSLVGYGARLAEMLLTHPSLDAELEEGLPTRHAESVAATIALSYQQLDPTSKRDELAFLLLQRAAQLAPAPIPHRLLVRLADRDPDDEGQAAEIDAPLRRLAAVGLIELLPNSGAALHRLVAAFVRDQDSDEPTSAKRAAARLIIEVDAINTAGYPLHGQPYLVHLITAANRETQLDAKQLTQIQNQLGYLLRAQGDLEGARPYFESALAINEKVFGLEHPNTAGSYNNLGALLQDLGDLVKARPYYERALAINEQVLGLHHPDTARYLNNIGHLLQAQGDLKGARSYYERALAINEQVLGSQHLETTNNLSNIGYLLHAQGDLEGAHSYFERALAIYEQVLGEHHPDTANSLSNFGALLQSQGDLVGARSYFERALVIYEQVLGEHHPDTARSLNNLGTLLHAQGDLGAARSYYERALSINEQVPGSYHPDTAKSLNNLGALLRDQGEMAKARTYFERALAINEQVLGSQHPDTAVSLNNLGSLLNFQGNFVKARSYYERALTICEQVLGPFHPNTAVSLSNLGLLLHRQGKLAEARPYYERVLAIYEQVLGAFHPNTATSLNNLGALVRAEGNLSAARSYFERALTICEQVLGSQHSGTAASLNNIGTLLHTQGDLAGARPYLERALVIREQTFGTNHPDTAHSLNNLGALLRDQGDLERARPYFERALSILTTHLVRLYPSAPLRRRKRAHRSGERVMTSGF